jgi:hypothetical protein
VAGVNFDSPGENDAHCEREAKVGPTARPRPGSYFARDARVAVDRARRRIVLERSKYVELAVDVALGGLQPFDLAGEPPFQFTCSLIGGSEETRQQLADRRAAQSSGEQVLDEDNPVDHGVIEVAPATAGALGCDESRLLVVPQ